MSDLKMSDVFNLPVYQNESEFFKCVINMPDCKKAIGQMNSDSWSSHAVHAINNHDRLVEKVAQLEADKAELLGVLADISNMCIGEIAMGCKLDAQSVGESIYKATGLTNQELNNILLNSLLQKHKW